MTLLAIFYSTVMISTLLTIFCKKKLQRKISQLSLAKKVAFLFLFSIWFISAVTLPFKTPSIIDLVIKLYSIMPSVYWLHAYFLFVNFYILIQRFRFKTLDSKDLQINGRGWE